MRSILAKLALALPLLTACSLPPVELSLNAPPIDVVLTATENTVDKIVEIDLTTNEQVKQYEAFLKEIDVSNLKISISEVGADNTAVAAVGTFSIQENAEATPVYTSPEGKINVVVGETAEISLTEEQQAAVGAMVKSKKKFSIRFAGTIEYKDNTPGPVSFKVAINSKVLVTPGL